MKGISSQKILTVREDSCVERDDNIVVEEPLEIRLKYFDSNSKYRISRVAVTMRTPGFDEELAKGFLYGEGIISDFLEIEKTTLKDNVIELTMNSKFRLAEDVLNRNFYTTSSCGVCGKASIESINYDTQFLPWSDKSKVSKETICKVKEALNNSQLLFNKTGGIHACGLFDLDGNLIDLKEDVGRHNAMDKLIGNLKKVPCNQCLILLSGRASFELVQKASKAGLPILAAIGAPSTLAIQLAQEMGMTLIGFIQNKGFNIYSCPERVEL